MISFQKNDNLFLLFRFALSFLLVIAIPLAVTYGISQYTVNNFKQNTLDSFSVMINNNFEALNKELKQMENTVETVVANPEVIKFSEMQNFLPSQLLTIRDTLSTFQFAPDLVQDVYLYNNALDCVVGRGSSYISSKTLFNISEGKFGSYNQWSLQLRNRTWSRQYIASKEEGPSQQYLTYSRSIPMTLVSPAKGKINVLISRQAMLSRFEDILGSKGDLYIIDNRNDNLLLSFNGQPYQQDVLDSIHSFQPGAVNQEHKIGRTAYFISYLKNADLGLSYLFIIPKSPLLSSVKATNVLLMAIVTAAMLTGLLLSLYLSLKKAKDFKALLSSFSGNGLDLKKSFGFKLFQDSEYIVLKEEVDKLVADKNSFESQLEQQKVHSNTIILEKLIAGRYADQKSLDEDLAQSTLSFEANTYAVMLLRLGREYRLMMGKESVKEFVFQSLYSIVDEYIILHEISAKNIVVLFPLDGEIAEIKQYIRKTASKIEAELSYTYQIEITLGVGALCSTLLGIHTAYQQAKDVVDYNILGYERNVLWYDELTYNKELCVYPVELENKLYNYTMLGNKLEISQILGQIYQENYVRRRLSVKAAFDLLEKVNTTLERLCADSGMQELLEHRLTGQNSTAETFDNINQIFQMLCDQLNEQNQLDNQKNIHKIVQYVDENYHDSELSLSALSIRFKLNENYLSTLFKEHIGQNFLSYVESKRIEKACQLISEGQNSISAIASMVGYVNDGTFRRAFKRNKGTSPSVYAEECRRSN